MFISEHRLKIASLRFGKHRIVKNIASLRKVNIAHPYLEHHFNLAFVLFVLFCDQGCLAAYSWLSLRPIRCRWSDDHIRHMLLLLHIQMSARGRERLSTPTSQESEDEKQSCSIWKSHGSTTIARKGDITLTVQVHGQRLAESFHLLHSFSCKIRTYPYLYIPKAKKVGAAFWPNKLAKKVYKWLKNCFKTPSEWEWELDCTRID